MKPDNAPVDMGYLRQRLLEMLAIPSPTGFTNELSRYVCNELEQLGIGHELTRRGTIIARMPGAEHNSSVRWPTISTRLALL